MTTAVSFRDARIALRGFAVLTLVSAFDRATSINPYLGVAPWLLGFVDVAGLMVGLIWIRRLNLVLGAARLARRLRNYCIVYLVFAIATRVVPGPASEFALAAHVVLDIAVFIAGLVLLQQFRKILRAVAAGRCVNCRYDLRALPEPRCPECGTTFLPLTPDQP